jgi:hypothetical protein
MTPTVVAFIAMSAALLVGLVLVAYGSIAKNDWGVNLDAVACPKCNTQLSYTRVPASPRQALWGGYTCPKCGCEVDKWGREITQGKLAGLASRAGLQRDRPPTTFRRLLLRNFLLFAPALYVARILLDHTSTLRERLLHPIASVIFSTVAFTAVLMAFARDSRQQNGANDPNEADDADQSGPVH